MKIAGICLATRRRFMDASQAREYRFTLAAILLLMMPDGEGCVNRLVCGWFCREFSVGGQRGVVKMLTIEGVLAGGLVFTLFYEGKRPFESGGLAGTRTLDQCLKRALLCQLSYQPTGTEAAQRNEESRGAQVTFCRRDGSGQGCGL